eukprot:2966758-Pleurochrysis_carterae.AAC.1
MDEELFVCARSSSYNIFNVRIAPVPDELLARTTSSSFMALISEWFECTTNSNGRVFHCYHFEEPC